MSETAGEETPLLKVEDKLDSDEWEVAQVAAGDDGTLKVTIDRSQTPGEDQEVLTLPRDGRILPPGLADAVRQAARRANSMQATENFSESAHRPGLEALAAPDDRTVRAVTHPHTHPDAVIGHRAKIHPTARIDAHATIGDRAEIGRYAHVGPRATVERLAIVEPGTRIPPGNLFLENPTVRQLDRQREWKQEGTQAVERIEGKSPDQAGGSTGPEEPGTDNPAAGNVWETPAADRLMDAIQGIHRTPASAAAQEPPPMPDRGSGHATGGAGRQQERSGPGR